MEIILNKLLASKKSTYEEIVYNFKKYLTENKIFAKVKQKSNTCSISTVAVLLNPEYVTLRKPNTYFDKFVSSNENDVIVLLVAETLTRFPETANVTVVEGITPTNELLITVNRESMVK
jgi:hypothetical protein